MYPTRRQIFAGKTDSTFSNIWEWVISKWTFTIPVSKQIPSFENWAELSIWRTKLEEKSVEDLVRSCESQCRDRRWLGRVNAGSPTSTEPSKNMDWFLSDLQTSLHHPLFSFSLYSFLAISSDFLHAIFSDSRKQKSWLAALGKKRIDHLLPMS